MSVGTDSWHGILFTLASLASIVVGTILFKVLAPKGSLWVGNGVQNLAGGLALLPFAFTLSDVSDIVPSARLLGAFAFLVLGGSILAYLLWFHLLKVCGATAASAYHFLMPPLGMLFAFLVLGEHVEFRDLLGIVPVALGIYLVTRPRQGHESPLVCTEVLRQPPGPEPSSVVARLDPGMADRKQSNPKHHAHKHPGNDKPAAKAEPHQPFRLRDLCKIARAGPDHRRVRRRSVGDRHLQPGRRAARLRHRLDHAADLSADGGDPGNFRAGRPRHRPRHIGQCVPALFAVAAQCGGGAAVHRQHHQHRGRSRRHGGRDQTADRRPQHRLRAGVRRDLGGGADLPRLQALRLRC